MTPGQGLVAVLVRGVGLSAIVVVYTLVTGQVDQVAADALGRGLLAFLLVLLSTGLWAFVDGLRHPVWQALTVWVAVAVVGGLAWWAGLALITPSLAGGATGEDTVGLTLALVLPAAVVGALVGAGGRRLAGRVAHDQTTGS